jgi:quercetin dioxygenase-like cupin family protein
MDQHRADVIVSGPGEGERFDSDNRTVLVKAALPQISVNEIEFESSFSVAPHRHDDHVDSFYVLDGEVEFTLESGVVTAGPGTLVSAPPGTLHGFGTRGPGRARVLNVHAPDSGFAESLRRR